MYTGKVKTLYSDKEKTEVLFPVTKTSAVSDAAGVGLDALLNKAIYASEEEKETIIAPTNVDTLGGVPADNYATKSFVTNAITNAQLNGDDDSSEIDLSGFATKDDISSITPESIGAVSAQGGRLSDSLTVEATPTGGQGYIVEKIINDAQEKLQLYIDNSGLPSASFVENGTEQNRMVLTREDTRFVKPVSISSGGTGATTAEEALDNLGAIAKCVNVQEANTNLNDYKQEGWYFFSSPTAPVNIPIGVNGWLHVIQANFDNQQYCKQIWYHLGAIDSSDHQTYLRTYVSTTGWSRWVPVTTDKCTPKFNKTVSVYDSSFPTLAYKAAYDTIMTGSVFFDQANRRHVFRSYNADTDNLSTRYSETYYLPIATAGLTEHKSYSILTTKNTVAVAQGGTGSTNGATGLKNLLAAGNTVLSSYQYGTALPTAGTKGRLFFKVVE